MESFRGELGRAVVAEAYLYKTESKASKVTMEVGYAHNSEEVRESTTLAEQRGIALTGVSDEGMDSRLKRFLLTTNRVQELQRKLYQKAKSEPNFRFYALYDKVYRSDVLIEVWKRVKANHGAPGIDGKRIEDIEKSGVGEFLLEIQDELRSGRYKPTPARRVYIPKPNGKKRPLSIPSIKERVIQMALKIVIEPIFEAGFEDNSYGYRPKRSGQQAALEIKRHLNNGFNKVIEADLEDCFGSIPHRELMDMIAEKIVDRKVLRLVKMFLKVGVMEEGQITMSDRGTPQGGVASPLFANIYLDRIDKGWKPLNGVARLIRYADDLVIITRHRVNESMERLRALTTSLKLRLHPEKTRVVDAEKESFDFLGYSFRRVKRWRDGKLRAYFWPSKKAEGKVKERIRVITNPKRPIGAELVVQELNRTLRGWVNYFRIANSSEKFGKIRLYAEQKVRKFMRRRRNRRGHGYKRYTSEYLHKVLGVYNDYRLSWTKAY